MDKPVSEQDLIAILREILECDPITIVDDRGDEACFYCDAFNTRTHEPNCLYLRAVQAVEQYDRQAAATE